MSLACRSWRRLGPRSDDLLILFFRLRFRRLGKIAASLHSAAPTGARGSLACRSWRSLRSFDVDLSLEQSTKRGHRPQRVEDPDDRGDGDEHRRQQADKQPFDDFQPLRRPGARGKGFDRVAHGLGAKCALAAVRRNKRSAMITILHVVPRLENNCSAANRRHTLMLSIYRRCPACP